MSRRRDERRPSAGDDSRPTFAEELERLGLLDVAARATRETIARSNADAITAARFTLRVISCFACTAPKACCTMVTGAYFHEGVAVAARLIADGRDTPALRQALAVAADDMETLDVDAYHRPCVFLDDGDRCTVYDDRPSICGVHLVTSPAQVCAEARATTISAVSGTAHVDVPRAAAEQVRAALGLPALDVPYRGAYPRMVLLALEAWDRRDHVSFLAEHLRRALHRYRWATR